MCFLCVRACGAFDSPPPTASSFSLYPRSACLSSCLAAPQVGKLSFSLLALPLRRRPRPPTPRRRDRRRRRQRAPLLFFSPPLLSSPLASLMIFPRLNVFFFPFPSSPTSLSLPFLFPSSVRLLVDQRGRGLLLRPTAGSAAEAVRKEQHGGLSRGGRARAKRRRYRQRERRRTNSSVFLLFHSAPEGRSVDFAFGRGEEVGAGAASDSYSTTMRSLLVLLGTAASSEPRFLPLMCPSVAARWRPQKTRAKKEGGLKVSSPALALRAATGTERKGNEQVA